MKIEPIDRDLHIGRIAAYVLLCANLVVMLANVYCRNWLQAAAPVLWAATCLVWARSIIPAQVKTRRMSRENAENIAEMAAEIRRRMSAVNN